MIVLAPGFWLTMTSDGQRRTDAMLLHWFGQEAITINYSELNVQLTEQQWMQVYEQLHWKCENQKSAFGETSCIARVGSINEIPAQYIVAFFVAARLNAVKITYRDIYHQSLLEQLNKLLGKANGDITTYKDQSKGDQVLRWSLDDGIVIMKKQLEANDEPVLIWLGSEKNRKH